MTSIPTLETERLLLRPMRMSDWPACEELMGSDRSKYMGGPYDAKAAWGWFCHDVAQWELLGHGALMVETRVDGALVGQVGINHGPLFPEHELGWFVFSGSEGKGYAFEAASALRDWAFGAGGLKTLVSYIDTENVRSRRLAERMGAVLDDDAVRVDAHDLVFRHPNPFAD